MQDQFPVANSVAQLLSLTFSGVTFVVVLTAAWKLSALLATITTKLENLIPLAEKVIRLEREVALMGKDLNSLWDAFRNFCQSKEAETEHFAEFLAAWDKRHGGTDGA